MPVTEVKSTPTTKKTWINKPIVPITLAIVGGTAIVTTAYFIGKSHGDVSFEIDIYPEPGGVDFTRHLSSYEELTD